MEVTIKEKEKTNKNISYVPLLCLQLNQQRLGGKIISYASEANTGLSLYASGVTMRKSGELEKKQHLWNQPNLSSNFFVFISYITKCKLLNFPMPQYLICKMNPMFYLPFNAVSQISDFIQRSSQTSVLDLKF